METTIKIHVAGDSDKIDPRTMAKAFAAFVDLLDAPAGHSTWRMTRIHLGSLELQARPLARTPEEEMAIFNTLTADLAELRVTGAPPSSWSNEGRAAANALRTLASAPGVEEITATAGEQTITFTALLEQEQHEQSSRISIGSVRGIIDRINTRGRCEFGLIDEAEQHPVKVRFSSAELDAVTALMGKRVSARGKLVRDAEGRKVLLHLHKIEEITTPSSVPTVSDLIGIWQMPSDKMSVEELVREMRRV